jgi:hypothetical protein
MGIIEVTSTDKGVIIVDFKELATHPKVLRKKASFIKNHVIYFRLNLDNIVEVFVEGAGEWQLDQNGLGGLPVATVNSVEPLNNEHLFDLLSNL